MPTSCLCGEPLRLTTDGSFKQNLQWSPDGKTLLLTRIHQGKMALWTMPAAGGIKRSAFGRAASRQMAAATFPLLIGKAVNSIGFKSSL